VISAEDAPMDTGSPYGDTKYTKHGRFCLPLPPLSAEENSLSE